ncbi:DUF2501 domain-containing protein [Luteibacter aegosomatis]|uniref:DUF2501 domain-containing protein n=1 Tax=Luteibacter aegosomatis TaxID=2911537 RepID=UPI001FFA3039|nr:DUF2501 domain-containing protein [Luteibacter aegosomatis]UPG85459.1 DUF2501 domain-containing protein [Luteibacter aegosomatis]
MKTVLALALTFTLASGSAAAGQLDKLGGLMGGSGGSLTSGSMGNAAGVIQYCISNNYLGGDSGAAGVKDQLLGKLGAGDQTAASNDASSGLMGKLGKKSTTAAVQPSQDKGYLDGAKGLLRSGDGKTLDLAGAQGGAGGDLKAQVTRKVCDAVLKQGKKWVGM